MEIQPLCVILSHTLVQGKRNTQVPPYIDLIEQLTTQGYELCALRMSRLQVEQVQTAYKLIGGRNSCSTATVGIAHLLLWDALYQVSDDVLSGKLCRSVV